MKRRGLFLALLLVAVLLLGFGFFLLRASVSALDEPSRLETYAATKAKRWLVGRSARGLQPPAPGTQDVTMGGMQFRARCSSCHGLDGRTPTDIGRAMYPRVPDLSSPAVQEWTDAELFWITKNGIRLSGMPSFGKSLSDAEIWPLVSYLRSLRAQYGAPAASPPERAESAAASSAPGAQGRSRP